MIVFRNRRRAKLVQEPVTGSAFPVSDIRVRPRAGTSESPTLIHSSKLSTDGSSKVGGGYRYVSGTLIAKLHSAQKRPD